MLSWQPHYNVLNWSCVWRLVGIFETLAVTLFRHICGFLVQWFELSILVLKTSLRDSWAVLQYLIVKNMYLEMLSQNHLKHLCCWRCFPIANESKADRRLCLVAQRMKTYFYMYNLWLRNIEVWEVSDGYCFALEEIHICMYVCSCLEVGDEHCFRSRSNRGNSVTTRGERELLNWFFSTFHTVFFEKCLKIYLCLTLLFTDLNSKVYKRRTDEWRTVPTFKIKLEHLMWQRQGK